ncbi:hypothetical protein GCM10008110_11810 [Marinobacter persicus]|nr:hypothetical protein GCM10008110_11810 [Marinobacter persicus]
MRLTRAILGPRYFWKAFPATPLLDISAKRPIPQSGFRGLLPKISKAMDGLREAHMGEASVYEAKLHVQPNDSNL